MMNKHRIGFLILILSLLMCSTAGAKILFQTKADNDAGACNTVVSGSIWANACDSSDPVCNMYYRCDTPVSGHTKYYRIDGTIGGTTGVVNSGQHAGYNIHSATVNLTSGNTYYYGVFVRYDTVNTSRLWWDKSAELGKSYSADKFNEIQGNIRIIMASGFPDWMDQGCTTCVGKFTLSAYIDPDHCTACTVVNPNYGWAVHSSMPQNVAPYGRNNAAFLSTYGKWYALVFAITPSHGATLDGRLQTWINGIKVQDYPNVATQDTTNPTITVFQHNGTWSQATYDSPLRQVKMDSITFSDSLTDMQNAGLMSDPGAGGGSGSSGSSTPSAPSLMN